MSQVAGTDFEELLLSDEPSIGGIVTLRRRVFESAESQEAFKEFRDRVASEESHAGKVAYVACLWAEGKYKEVLDLSGSIRGSEAADYITGRALAILGRTKEALEALEKVAESSADGAAVAAFSQILRHVGDYERAEKAVKRALRKSPESPALLTEAGILADIRGESEAAAEYYNSALEADGEFVEALFRLAFVHDLRGDNEKALELYRRCIQIKPVRSRALVNLGLLYEELGRDREALKCFKMVQKRHPTNRRIRLYVKDAQASQDMYFDEELQKRRERRNKILETPITDFELSVRSRNCLEKMDVTTLGDLTEITEEELLSFKNFGETSLEEIKKMMSSKGLRLGQALEEDAEESASAREREESEKQSRQLGKPVEELGLSVRSQHCMNSLGIKTIGELAEKTEKDLLGARNFGQTSLAEVRRKLAALGLSLGGG